MIVKSRYLLEHFSQAVSNERKFNPIYWEIFAKPMAVQLQRAYLHCWDANNIVVKKKLDYQRRKIHQENAVVEYKSFLGLLSPATKIYHLPLRRVEFWSNEVSEILKLISGWKRSDKERYAKIYE